MRSFNYMLILLLLSAALTQAAPPPADPLQAALKNGTYQLGDRTVTLKNGMYAEANGFAVRVLDKWIRTGDLNGDGKPDALAVVSANRQGHDFSHYLVAAIDSGDGHYFPVAGFLGELLELDAVDIGNNEVQAGFRYHAVGDHLCCPTLQTQRRFALENGKLLCRFSNSLSLQPEAVRTDVGSPYGAATSRIETGRLRLAKAVEPGDRYPEHVRLWLGGTGSSGAFVPAEPQLRVIPVEGFEAILEGADLKTFREQIKTLKGALSAKPDHLPPSVPFFPALRTAPMAFGQAARVEFKNGAGLRYHMIASVNAVPLYAFQGLTKDGKYLVSCFGPLDANAATDAALDRWLSSLDIAGN
jgi:hypothetical protein